MPWLVLMLLLFPAMLFSEESSNIIMIHDVTANAGEVIQVDVEIINHDSFVGFQMNIDFDPAFNYVAESIQLSDRASVHEIIASPTSSGLAIICFSFPSTPFDGNEGVIASFFLETPLDAGEYALDIRNPILAGSSLPIESVPGTVLLLDVADKKLLTVDVLGQGNVFVNDEHFYFPRYFDKDSAVYLDAVALGGWHFHAWGGDTQGSEQSIEVVMDDDKHITAEFAQSGFQLTFDVMGEHGQSITDAVVTLNDSPYQPGEYQFSGLPPDTYIYMVSRDGYFDATGEVVILDGDVTETVVLHQDDTAIQLPDEHALRVYPNPATRQLNVEAPGSITTIRLFNPRGLEVYAASPHHTRHTIHTAAYPPGVFYLQVNTAARRITLPVVIAQ